MEIYLLKDEEDWTIGLLETGLDSDIVLPKWRDYYETDNNPTLDNFIKKLTQEHPGFIIERRSYIEVEL